MRRWLPSICLLVISLLSQATWATDWEYTARPGDSLWTLSEEFLGDALKWKKLADHNQIDYPKGIRPGQRIKFPYEWLATKQLEASLVSFHGEVRVLRREEAVPLARGEKLSIKMGDHLKTGAASFANVLLADGSSLWVYENSHVLFDAIRLIDGGVMVDVNLKLTQGRVQSKVKPFSRPGSRYIITTPSAYTAVRGTDFRVAFDAASATMMSEVEEGAVNVANEKGRQRVNAGFGVVAKAGEAVAAPVALLIAPQLDPVDDMLVLQTSDVPAEFSWQRLDGAKKYRAQFYYVGGDSDVLVVDKSVSAAQVKVKVQQEGRYRLVVRGIDENGLEGASAHVATSINFVPTPVELGTPANGSAVIEDLVEFRWRSGDPADEVRYRFELRTEGSESHLLALDLVDSSYAMEASELALGQVFEWRVVSIDSDGVSAASEWRSVYRPHPLVTPKGFDAAYMKQRESLVFSWDGAQTSADVEIQLATDAAFEYIVARYSDSRQPSLEVAAPAEHGKYYARMRLTRDGVLASDYTDSVIVEVGTVKTFKPLLMLLPLLIMAL